MRDFWISLGLTFWAEMGDKTQLVALAYATRYSLRHVLLGILWATAAVHLVSVGLGRLIGTWIPRGYAEALSAVCFLAFAVWTLRGDDDDGQVRESGRHPVLLIGVSFFLAELGDKTMLTAATLATTRAWAPVWAGSTIGMVLSDGLAVWVGRVLGKKIPEKVVQWFAAGLFFLFGGWYALLAVRAFR